MCVRCRIARPLMPANEQKNVWDDDPHLFFKVEVTEVSATDGWVFFFGFVQPYVHDKSSQSSQETWMTIPLMVPAAQLPHVHDLSE